MDFGYKAQPDASKTFETQRDEAATKSKSI